MLTYNKMMNYEIIPLVGHRYLGKGLIQRDNGRLPPTVRNMIDKIGNDKITSLTLFRTPITVSKILNYISRGEFNNILKKQGYDNAFHLAVLINGKYVLDKQEVIHLENGSIPNQAETLPIEIGNSDLTINDLLENTKNKMGSDFTPYSAKNNNCQDFILAMLQANKLADADNTKFVKQDAKSIFEQLPQYAEVLTNLITDTAGAVERLQNGEGKITRKVILLFP
jgi:hypothetical protein